MQIAKFVVNPGDRPAVGLVEDQTLRPLDPAVSLSTVLHDDDPVAFVHRRVGRSTLPLAEVRLLAPIDAQEVWGAGVTYERSKVARIEESEQGGSFYDQVYTADRPELFFKATPSRVVGPGQPIRIRRDTRWCVPEPELTLVLSPTLRLVGLTIGNDVSARDIEGRNPLYLPQAKVFDACCALGPVISLVTQPPTAPTIRLRIEREGQVVFEGATNLARMVRSFDELIGWLGRDNRFPDGVFLLTGTGIVPPDEFSLRPGDEVAITIDGIGVLRNPVIQDAPLV